MDSEEREKNSCRGREERGAGEGGREREIERDYTVFT